MKFNNTEIKTPSMLSFKPEKVWSSNTKRTASGLMVGDVIAIKETITITWNTLSPQQVAQLDAIISNAFFNVTFMDPRSNTEVTKQFYASTPTYSVYSYVNNMFKYTGTALDIIER